MNTEELIAAAANLVKGSQRRIDSGEIGLDNAEAQILEMVNWIGDAIVQELVTGLGEPSGANHITVDGEVAVFERVRNLRFTPPVRRRRGATAALLPGPGPGGRGGAARCAVEVMRFIWAGRPRETCNNGSAAGKTEAVSEVVIKFVALQAGDVVADDKALIERFGDRPGQPATQFGEANQPTQGTGGVRSPWYTWSVMPTLAN